MKTVVLREPQVLYELADGAILANEEVILEQDGQPIAALLPIAQYEAFLAWRAVLDHPGPGEPPPTFGGDLEALAAVDRIRTMFPPMNEESAQYIAESLDLTLDYRFLLDEEG
jgi:L-ascorbate metabolism protein UlaG (beta-lactamase superfamily)